MRSKDQMCYPHLAKVPTSVEYGLMFLVSSDAWMVSLRPIYDFDYQNVVGKKNVQQWEAREPLRMDFEGFISPQSAAHERVD